MMNEALNLGAMQFSQPQQGYRFSADAVALAEFAQPSATDTVLDLCSGCGVVLILMWQRAPFRNGVGVELDLELATLAQINVTQFHLEDKIRILQADIRCLNPDNLKGISTLDSASRFDVITANPPYWPAGRGRLNPNLQKAAARHEISLTLEEFFGAALRFLKPGGRLYLSHLASRKSQILENLAQAGLVIRRTLGVSGLTGRLLIEAHLDKPPSEIQA